MNTETAQQYRFLQKLSEESKFQLGNLLDRLLTVRAPINEFLDALEGIHYKTCRLEETQEDPEFIVNLITQAVNQIPYERLAKLSQVPPKRGMPEHAEHLKALQYAKTILKYYTLALELNSAYTDRTDSELKRLSSLVRTNTQDIASLHTAVTNFNEQHTNQYNAAVPRDIFRAKTGARELRQYQKLRVLFRAPH